MSSYLRDQLVQLEINELKNKEKQDILKEQIQFELEKQTILMGDANINKLQTHLGIFHKNIEGNIMCNNKEIVKHQLDENFRKEGESISAFFGIITDEEYRKKTAEEYRKKTEEYRKKCDEIQRSNIGNNEDKITLDKFISNLDLVNEETKNKFSQKHSYKGNGINKPHLTDIPHKIKIYNDIMPLFQTMIGILKQQQSEIETLKKYIKQ